MFIHVCPSIDFYWLISVKNKSQVIQTAQTNYILINSNEPMPKIFRAHGSTPDSKAQGWSMDCLKFKIHDVWIFWVRRF